MPAPYKSLVLCFDGTWNSLKSNTNVSRLYSEIADASTGCATQQKFYDEGVGTRFGERVRGGAFGQGLDRNIRLGYAWLATTFECERGAIRPRPGAGATAAAPAADATRAAVASASDASAAITQAAVAAAGPADASVTTEVTVAASSAAPPAPARKRNGDLASMPPHSSGVEFLTGSDLYLIGFSRGAYTARSLGGLVNYLGIPEIDPANTGPAGSLADHPAILEAWALYAARPSDAERRATDAATVQRFAEHAAKVAEFRARATTRYPVRIHFVGVWDTVGALGIPKVAWLPRSTTYQFHDTSLSEGIRNAFHAMAIDEHRQEYKATLWTAKTRTTESIEQCWFPGAHADVGGGYEDDLLPAAPLLWMAQRAAGCGLQFIDDRTDRDGAGSAQRSTTAVPAAFDLIGTEYMSPVHDSYGDFMRGIYSAVQRLPWMAGRVYRRMLVALDGFGQQIDPTAFQKWRADPEYRPPNLGQAGRQDVTYAMARDLDAVDAGTDVVVQQTTTTVVVSGASA